MGKVTTRPRGSIRALDDDELGAADGGGTIVEYGLIIVSALLLVYGAYKSLGRTVKDHDPLG